MPTEEPGPPTVAHADGTLTVTARTVEVEVKRGGGYRGTITVPRERCTLRVMGRAIAVFDEGRLVHLCSRCKPGSEVTRLIAELGDRVTSERRTPFATLLELREESAAFRPPGEAAAARGHSAEPETPDASVEIPPGHESLRRVYLSQATMERDSRRLRAAGWIELRRDLPAADAPQPTAGRLRGLLRAADPSREPAETTITWIRPLDQTPATTD